jgi:hypothetical protein
VFRLLHTSASQMMGHVSSSTHQMASSHLPITESLPADTKIVLPRQKKNKHKRKSKCFDVDFASEMLMML